MRCVLFETCPIYNETVPVESGLGKLFKQRYCERGGAQCARLLVSEAVGRAYVPPDLFPNIPDRAEDIIRAVQSAGEQP
jgi:hypothetical protein